MGTLIALTYILTTRTGDGMIAGCRERMGAAGAARKPEGQVFPVREGRNLIGRGAECEVSIPDDSTLSNVDSHITYRKSFVIGDMVSRSGTDFNRAPIEEQFVPLPNYATIRTGSTQATFMAIQPAPASASASAGESPEKT